jgi:hypothetical protein
MRAPGRFRILRGSSIGLIVIMTASAALQSLTANDSVQAVTTSGTGVLTKCRDWLVYSSCTTYHNIALPERMTVGDDIHLRYGSNPKSYRFHVISIYHEAERCTVLSEVRAEKERGDKIEVAQCQTVP